MARAVAPWTSASGLSIALTCRASRLKDSGAQHNGRAGFIVRLQMPRPCRLSVNSFCFCGESDAQGVPEKARSGSNCAMGQAVTPAQAIMRLVILNFARQSNEPLR